MKSSDTNALIVYYSYEGNTEFIARTISTVLDADIIRLTPKKEMDSAGFAKYFWGGKEVVQKKKPELQPYDKDPNNYDLIVIGTPVWAFTFTPSIRSFLANHQFHNKKIALFCCHQGMPGKCLANMERELKDNNVIGKIDFFKPKIKNTDENRQKAIKWADSLSGI